MTKVSRFGKTALDSRLFRFVVLKVRFVMRETIEESMLALQQRKQKAFDATVGSEKGTIHRLNEDDLRFLFGFS